MKAFVTKVDTAQSITQWYWRPPTSSRCSEPLRPDLTDSRTRCSKLPSRGSRASYREPSITKWRNAVLWCWERPETNHGDVTYHKVTLKKKQRRNHSQRASGGENHRRKQSQQASTSDRIRDGTISQRASGEKHRRNHSQRACEEQERS